jgi:BirA family biotin operon repressor/biotin-[acetyl-CoA-carboxylase] ligase
MQRFHYDTIDSTNSEARRLAFVHPGHRLLVTATTQTAGRGQQGRAWQSPPGGAWMSFLWPLCTELRTNEPVSLVVARAVRRAVVEVVGENGCAVDIKWPNDLLIDGRKVAGILCETFAGGSSTDSGITDSSATDSSATGSGRILVIGIGVNVEFDLARLGDQLRGSATTLAASCGRSIEVEPVIAAVARHVVEAIDALERRDLSVHA